MFNIDAVIEKLTTYKEAHETLSLRESQAEQMRKLIKQLEKENPYILTLAGNQPKEELDESTMGVIMGGKRFFLITEVHYIITKGDYSGGKIPGTNRRLDAVYTDCGVYPYAYTDFIPLSNRTIYYYSEDFISRTLHKSTYYTAEHLEEWEKYLFENFSYPSLETVHNRSKWSTCVSYENNSQALDYLDYEFTKDKYCGGLRVHHEHLDKVLFGEGVSRMCEVVNTLSNKWIFLSALPGLVEDLKLSENVTLKVGGVTTSEYLTKEASNIFN